MISYQRALRRAMNLDAPHLALQAIKELKRAIRELETAAVTEALRQGVSKTDVATALGITRQALHHRLTRQRQLASPEPVRAAAVPEPVFPGPDPDAAESAAH